MTPYYQKDGIAIYCCNALDLLPELTPGSIGLVATDPPYGISNEVVITRSKNKMKFGNAKDIVSNFGQWDKFATEYDFWKFTFAWADRCATLLRDGGNFISYFDRDKINFLSMRLQKKHGLKKRGYVADCKSNPVPQARKVSWMNGWEEMGVWAKPGKTTYNYQLGQHADYFMRPICGGNERTEHPTQKPLSVFKDIVAWWSNPDDTVLDPFMGSGTTAVACKLLGRKFIGCEREEKYVEIAVKRLSQDVMR